MIEYSGQSYERGATLCTERAQSTNELVDIAMEVLIWLGGQPEQLGRFLDLSGIRADQIRAHVEDAAFQQALVSFVMDHEPDLMEFCSSTGIAAQRVVHCYERARSEPVE